MVDALLSAARTEADESEILEISPDKEWPTTDEQGPLRFCEFCTTSNTPTWRRGPAGKGSLCNACGIKWRLRKRMKKAEAISSPHLDEMSLPSVLEGQPFRPPKKRKDEYDRPNKSVTQNGDILKDRFDTTEHVHVSKRKKYYCKYCNKTWALSHFRNSQQFGAHCSNCSRRPRLGANGAQSEANGQGELSEELQVTDGEASPTLLPLPQPSSSTSLIAFSTQSSHTDALLRRLHMVVEQGLVEPTELQEIMAMLQQMKSELLTQQERRLQHEMAGLRQSLEIELGLLRVELNGIVADQSDLVSCRFRQIEDLADFLMTNLDSHILRSINV